MIEINPSPLTVADIISNDDYEKIRASVQEKVIAHKQRRRVDLNQNISLFFEDRFTMWYQVQEMARAERLTTPEELAEELAAYNPLIPSGKELKATMMLMYEPVSHRKKWLERLVGIEHVVWMRVGAGDEIRAIADEDLERSTEDKTSAVHFMRFALDDISVAAFKQGEEVRLGVSHPAITLNTLILAPSNAQALASDLV